MDTPGSLQRQKNAGTLFAIDLDGNRSIDEVLIIPGRTGLLSVYDAGITELDDLRHLVTLPYSERSNEWMYTGRVDGILEDAVPNPFTTVCGYLIRAQ